MNAQDLLDAALLLLRVALGAYLVVHGLQKIDRRMSGGGLAAETQRLVADGFRDSRALAAISALTQVSAGLLLIAGALTFLGAAGAIGVMVVATATKLGHGFWVWADGAEFPLYLCLTAVVVGLAGPGAWSVDHALDIAPTPAVSLAAIAIGILSGVGSLPLIRHPASSAGTHPTPASKE